MSCENKKSGQECDCGICLLAEEIGGELPADDDCNPPAATDDPCGLLQSLVELHLRANEMEEQIARLDEEYAAVAGQLAAVEKTAWKLLTRLAPHTAVEVRTYLANTSWERGRFSVYAGETENMLTIMPLKEAWRLETAAQNGDDSPR